MKVLKRYRFGWMVMLFVVLVLFLCPVDSCALVLEESSKGGKVARREWKDESGKTVNGPEGYAYIVYTYKDTTVSEKYYTADDEPYTTAGGYAARDLTYGNKHRLTEMIFRNESGEMIDSAAGYAKVKLAYTSKGQVITTYFFDANNKPVLLPGWDYASISCEYRGVTMTSKVWLDTGRNPTDHSAGYAYYLQNVNKKNKITKIIYNHGNGKAALCAYGWSTLDYELDKKDRVTELVYYDDNGLKTDGTMGYARETRDYDTDRIYTVKRENAQGEPVLFDGVNVVSMRVETDSDDRVIRESFFDAEGNPTPGSTGTAAISYLYDTDGRMTGVVLEDEGGRQTIGNDGWSAYRDTLNEHGLITGRTFLDNDGNKVDLPQGYCEIRYAYDMFDVQTGLQYLAADGTTVRP